MSSAEQPRANSRALHEVGNPQQASDVIEQDARFRKIRMAADVVFEIHDSDVREAVFEDASNGKQVVRTTLGVQPQDAFSNTP